VAGGSPFFSATLSLRSRSHRAFLSLISPLWRPHRFPLPLLSLPSGLHSLPDLTHTHAHTRTFIPSHTRTHTNTPASHTHTPHPQWDDKTRWLSGDPCTNSWFGVQCDNFGVAAIALPANKLNGTLLPSLADLKHLQVLGRRARVCVCVCVLNVCVCGCCMGAVCVLRFVVCFVGAIHPCIRTYEWHASGGPSTTPLRPRASAGVWGCVCALCVCCVRDMCGLESIHTNTPLGPSYRCPPPPRSSLGPLCPPRSPAVGVGPVPVLPGG
jgi:hypothetical protein